MEEEFKIKMAQKFAEDERLEQMNAQKRRMRELQHKRDIVELLTAGDNDIIIKLAEDKLLKNWHNAAYPYCGKGSVGPLRHAD